ncbi:MAG: hypothetical protein BWY30_00663 [Tenericutes bacterium ADurb.Bin239]|nr:MAG: hypothetical protein BWY30_00663 [Tenericutes bacterium ADurb.Bin239]
MKKRLSISLIVGVFALLANVVVAKPDIVQVKADYAPYQVLNGGFETGDLTGWKVYRLWKDESGMAAFDASLVHGHTYFGSNPYGRDGNYQLGISSGPNSGDGPIKWDGGMAEERMGYLRSSDFILGGSGWISFKLGGGKHPSFAYLSVRKASDDTEIARFGNRHFNDTAKASAQYGSPITNAEAFLFQYYYDLSASLGEKLYFLLCETASYEWSVLSADSFVTYIESAPLPSADQTAINILPTVLNIGTADNSIKNGYFATGDLTHWNTSATQGWGYVYDGGASHPDDKHLAYSDQTGGDSAIGILRSSAFIVTDNKYVRYDWAGGMKYEKEIFVSVKETGTNIEKLRFVRRDNLKNHEGTGFDNHILDLSSLDSTKTYYLEFADNRAGGYGISRIKKVRFSNDFNPDYDRAVAISGLPTSFVVDPLQEAINYGAYFLGQTDAMCAALTGNLVNWANLQTEYGTLSDAAKDIFTDAATTDANVVAARERAVFLFNKYGAAEGWVFFIVDSNNVAYPKPSGVRPNDDTLPTVLSQTNIMLFVMIFVASAGLYVVMRRKRALSK